MLAELGRATAAQEPIVVTLWTPHWAYDAFPIKNLEDPEGTLGDAEQIHALARTGFTSDNPEVAAWMGTWTMPDDALASLAYLVIEVHGDGNERAAVEEWLSDPENAELVQSWIS
jgi:glycine betaine/proline transport system substrate-binding protein